MMRNNLQYKSLTNLTFYLGILSFFFLVNTTIVEAQKKLNGSMFYEDGSPIEGAVINILELDSSTFIDYTMTDAQGKWSIEAPVMDSFVIEFSMFGYGSEFMVISDKSQYAEPFNIKLQKTGFNLQEVTVKDEAIGVSQVDDTLTFNLGYFTTGAERTLGDVIQRLPGMEIRDGSVYYGGEKITKMLVQGRDIINNNQKLATEGIRADQLKNIKIIENYKEKSQQFNTQQSEDVAMDVRLKDNQLNKWSGEAEVLGGYPSSLKAEVNAFNLSDKVGISTFVRLNNVGEEVLDWDDIQGMLTVNRSGRHFRIIGGSFAALMPSGLRIGNEVQANRDGIVNINLDLKLSDELSIKGFAIGAYAERESEVFQRTEYLSENISRTATTNKQSESPIVSTVWKMEYQLDSLTYISASLPLSFNKVQSEYTTTGKYGDKQFNTLHNADEWNYLVLPTILMRRKIGEEGQWKVNTRYDASKLSGSNLYSDNFPFLGIPIADDSSQYSIFQDRLRFDEQFSISSDLKLVWGDWFLKPSVEYSTIHNILLFDTDNTGVRDFGKDAEMYQESAVAGLSGGYETSDWEIVPTITLNYSDRTFAEAGSQKVYFPGYDIHIQRKFNKAHRLTLNGSYGLSYPSFSEVQNTYEISSSTELSTGGYPIDLAQKSYNTSLRYHNYDVKSDMYIFSYLSYSHSDDTRSGFSEQYDDYILNGMIPIPYKKRFSSRLYVGKEFEFLPVRISPRLNYSWAEGFSASEGEKYITQNNSFRAGLEFDSRWEFPLNVELEFSYRHNTSDSENGSKRTFDSYSPELEIEYKISGFRIETDLNYDFSTSGIESSEIYTWNIETSYELADIPLTFSVNANNILNLEPKDRLVSNFGLNTNTFRRFRVFPGYIIGGVKWKF